MPKNPHVLTTNSGRKVRSKLEQQCANFLTEQGIEFKYEPLMLLAGRQYRPDFYLPQYDVFIEICGYNHMPFYRDRQEEKRKRYAQHGMKVIFMMHKRGEDIIAKLASELSKLKTA